jgi:hypothetical protein
MAFDRLNDRPDDNYRVYFRRREDRRLFCWLCYGRPETWAYYVCTQDGEPSHEVSPTPGAPRPDPAAAKAEAAPRGA